MEENSNMHCVRKVCEDLYWVGGNDHRLALFENIFPDVVLHYKPA